MLRLASLTQPNFEKIAKVTGTAQFITIDFSHYVEFSRWCLERKGKAFVEHAYAPAAHILPVLSVRMCGSQLHLSDSSRMLPAPAAGTAERTVSDRAMKKKGATAAPVLVGPDGSVLRDSWEIAEHAGFAPVEPTLKRILDEELGPLARQLAYAHVLNERNSAICNKLFTMCGGVVWKVLWFLGLGFFVKRAMSSSLRSADPAAVALCRDSLTITFSKLDKAIQSKSTAYLGGDLPGAADFAMASLASPIIGAHDYNKGKFDHLFSEMEATDPQYAMEVEHWRKTTVGEYCLSIYDKFRREVEK